MSENNRTASLSRLFADPHRVTSLFALLSGAVVAVVAAAASYEHMAVLAARAGQGSMSGLLPLSVDGMVVASSMALLTARRRGESPGELIYVALGLGLIVSVTANVLASVATLPPLTSSVVAAWPPVALAISYELVMRACGRSKIAPTEDLVGEQAASPVPAIDDPRDDPNMPQEDAGCSKGETRAHRVSVIVDRITAGHEITGAQVAHQFAVSTRTGQRILNDAQAAVEAAAKAADRPAVRLVRSGS